MHWQSCGWQEGCHRRKQLRLGGLDPDPCCTHERTELTSRQFRGHRAEFQGSEVVAIRGCNRSLEAVPEGGRHEINPLRTAVDMQAHAQAPGGGVSWLAARLAQINIRLTAVPYRLAASQDLGPACSS